MICGLQCVMPQFGATQRECRLATWVKLWEATAVMLVSALIVLARTIRLPRIAGETVTKDIAPWVVLLFVGLLVGFIGDDPDGALELELLLDAGRHGYATPPRRRRGAGSFSADSTPPVSSVCW